MSRTGVSSIEMAEWACAHGVRSPEQYDHFLRCVDNGCTARLAAMLATRSFPGTRTDRELFAGRWEAGGGLNPAEYEHHKLMAEEAGLSVNGKIYCHGLADYPGDPTAWVDGRGDIARVAREKGYKVTGLVEYTPPERAPLPDVAIAPELVDGEVDAILEANPDGDREAIRAEVEAVRSGRVDLSCDCREGDPCAA